MATGCKPNACKRARNSLIAKGLEKRYEELGEG